MWHPQTLPPLRNPHLQNELRSLHFSDSDPLGPVRLLSSGSVNQNEDQREMTPSGPLFELCHKRQEPFTSQSTHGTENNFLAQQEGIEALSKLTILGKGRVSFLWASLH